LIESAARREGRPVNSILLVFKPDFAINVWKMNAKHKHVNLYAGEHDYE